MESILQEYGDLIVAVIMMSFMITAFIKILIAICI